MSSLITGTAGLIGSYLAESLIQKGESVVATYLNPTIHLGGLESTVRLIELDVRSRAGVESMLDKERPQVIYHLAAQSLPTVSWLDPWSTMDININGTLNVFEGIKSIRKADPAYDPVVVVACSSAAYGASLTATSEPVTEEALLLPLHPYGVSKVAQDLLSYQYFVNDGIRSIRARIFNCTGPRKRSDVVSDFGKAVVGALRTGEAVRVGNLNSRRAIIDVRDMVSALQVLAAKGRSGEAYNICAETVVTIGEVLEMYLEIAGKRLPHWVDPTLLRPSDEPVIVGDTTKIRRDTGWSPTIPLRKTLQDVFDYEMNLAPH